MRMLHKALLAVLIAALAGGLLGVNRWGELLERQARDVWLQKASDETQRITDVSRYWLSLSHTQLRGLAALFHGSQRVTSNEFLDALALIEGADLSTVIPFNSFAYVVPGTGAPSEGSEKSAYPVALSSDTSGPFAAGKNLASVSQITACIREALQHPEQVVQGAAFADSKRRVFVPFATTAPNAGRSGVLLSVINLSDFVTDLDSLLIPKGVRLRIVERDASRRTGGYQTIVGNGSATADTVGTFFYPCQSGHIYWNYYWDILPGYLGGPDITLGRAVQWGGSALVCTVFCILAFLAVENVRVNRLVAQRTRELEAANREMEAFSYSVSHDLRAPLRAIDGFGKALVEECRDKLGDEGRLYLRYVQEGCAEMEAVIEGLLSLSRCTHGELSITGVDLSALARVVIEELRTAEPDRTVQVHIAPEVKGYGDSRLLKIVLENLLGNAWKYTSRSPGARIEFGTGVREGEAYHFVRDNGAGFDMSRADQLFCPFRRLHSASQFPGIGIGLATVQRIVHRHGGRIWAEASPGEGATFYFTLGSGKSPS